MKLKGSKINKDIYAKIGFVILCVFSVLYAVFSRHFSHIHITLPFGNLPPIFIGEILLFVCSILLIVHCRVNNIKMDKWYYLILAFVAWILIKTIEGKISYGNLSFRNAALFYYALFAVISYNFFKKGYFSQKVIIFGLIFIIFINLARGFYVPYTYQYFPILIFYLILTLHLENEKLKIISLIILAILFPFQNFFHSSRSHLLAFLISNLFILIFTSLIFAKFGNKIKLLIYSLIVLVVLIFGVEKFTPKTKIFSMLNFDGLIQSYKLTLETVEKRRKDYESKEIPVQLFNEEKTPLFTSSQKQVKKLDDNYKKSKSEISNKLDKFIDKTSNQIHDITNQEEFGKTSIVKTSTVVKDQKEDKGDILDAHTSLKLIDNILRNDEFKKDLQLELEQVIEMFEESEMHWKNALTIAEIKVENLIKKYMGLNPNYIIGNNKYLNKLRNQLLVEFTQTIKIITPNRKRSLLTENNNIIFRLLIWRDMIIEMKSKKAFLGMSFGHPQRSQSIEVLRMAYGEWSRDGWIAPHNSFLHIIYRAGIVGVILILFMIYSFINLTVRFTKLKCLDGILLLGIILYWSIMSNFLVILEFPYTAIPFWIIWGIAFAYLIDIEKKRNYENSYSS